jgi:glycosyltransferase involved in cell wall biosynthesis
MNITDGGNMRFKILGLGGIAGYSGVYEHLWTSMAKRHEIVKVIDTRLSGFWKYWNIFYCFWKLPGFSKYLHPIRTVLGEEVSYYRMRTIYYVVKKTAACERMINRSNTNYDIILQATPAGLGPAIVSRPTKPRCIYTDFTMKQSEREYPPWAIFFSQRDKRKWLELERESYHNATMIFTFSDNTRNSVIKDYGGDEERVVTTYSGVNLKELPTFKKDYSNKTILFTGIEFERKGGPTLKKAFKEVKKEVTDAKMVIVGAEPQINISDITIKGYINRGELLELYKEASIFAMPSICDPFPNVFFEAMAYKTPCIGSTASGIPEMIEDGKTGFLVPVNDHKKLADKLILLLENEDLMKKMGERGRKRVEKYFTWDLVVERMTKEFDRIDT